MASDSSKTVFSKWAGKSRNTDLQDLTTDTRHGYSQPRNVDRPSATAKVSQSPGWQPIDVGQDPYEAK